MSESEISIALRHLQDWYISHCDEEWEHSYGVRIDTLDNPGWMVKIDLVGSRQLNQDFEEIKIDYDHDTNWIIVSKREDQLYGACGPQQLSKMLPIMTNWLELKP